MNSHCLGRESETKNELSLADALGGGKTRKIRGFGFPRNRKTMAEKLEKIAPNFQFLSYFGPEAQKPSLVGSQTEIRKCTPRAMTREDRIVDMS